ncbi:MAG: biotin--[acetyl-CoA-carboxylase] ligase [Microbacteriaceae bacterium]|nr:biotin--[acetyl-CoA-carboxylase] ligase [Microbacteriaceae bacterium]
MSDRFISTRIELAHGGSATLEQHAEVGSTNALMRERFVDGEERFERWFTIATASQTDGRGRLDREWIAAPGEALALTVYLEFDEAVARRALGWVSLAAGLAVADAVSGLADDAAGRVRVKWPNDVLVDGRKACGILGELLGVIDGGRAFGVAVGIGVNTRMPAGSLPTPQSTSLQVAGLIGAAEPSPMAKTHLLPQGPELTDGARRFTAAIVSALAARIDRLVQAGGDADESGLRTEFERRSATLGARVRVLLPGDEEIEGDAVGVGAGGELRVRLDSGEVRELQVGDVEHVRPATGGWAS